MWILWPIFILFYHLVNSANNVPECRNGTVCSQGHICKDNVCKECIKCALLFRKGSVCESDFNGCGPCLPGYKEVSVTNFSNIVKPCRPEKLRFNSCTNDEDCSTGSYCYENFCAVCFDCSILNKLPPSNGCAKDLYRCGLCLNGYYELPVTTYSDIQICERKIQESNNFPKLVLTISNILPSCILIMFTAVVIKLIIRKYKATDDTKAETCVLPLSPSAPPLVSDTPKNVLLKEEKCCSAIAFATELKQQANAARVFKQPHALYYFSEESADDASDHSNDSNEEGSGPPVRSEPEEACFPRIFVHSYAEMNHSTSPFQEISESLWAEGQINIPMDNVDSESPVEDGPKTSLQNEDSKSSKF